MAKKHKEHVSCAVDVSGSMSDIYAVTCSMCGKKMRMGQPKITGIACLPDKLSLKIADERQANILIGACLDCFFSQLTKMVEFLGLMKEGASHGVC